MRRHRRPPTSTLQALFDVLRHPRKCPVCGRHKELFYFPDVGPRNKLCARCGMRLDINTELKRIMSKAIEDSKQR